MAPLTWWPFLVLIFLLGIFLKVYPLTAFSVVLAILSMLSRWWKERSLDKITYQRRLYYRRGFPGEKIELKIEVENQKFLPISWLKIEDPWPTAVGPEDLTMLRATHSPELGMLVNLFALRWYERVRRPYKLLLRTRGVYQVGPPQLESGDLFGLFEQYREEGPVDYLTVFPLPIPYQELKLPTSDPFGDRRARRRLYEDPNLAMGVRDYYPEDDFRRIHWPATAHTGQLQVKVYQPVSAQVLVVCFNVSTLPHTWEGIYPGLLEHLISVSATIVQRGLEQGYQVGLISNGCLAHSDQPFRVPPGRSPNQLVRLLTALAGVTPFITSSFDRLLISEAPRLPYGATLIIITGLMSPAIVEAILRLKQHGRKVTLLSFASQAPPKIPGVLSVHLPYQD